MTPYLRGWILPGIAELILKLGGDIDHYATRFHLPLRPTDKQDDLLPGPQVVKLMEACAKDLRCPDFGLRAGLSQGSDALGPIALVAIHCATSGEAVDAVARYVNLLNTALELQLRQTEAGPQLAYELNISRSGSARQFCEWSLAVGLRMFKLVAGAQAHPRSIYFSHAPLLPEAFYRAFFGCPVTFLQPGYGANYFAADFARPMSRNDPELKTLLLEHVEMIADAATLDLEDQVNTLIRKLFSTGHCTLPIIATHYHVSVRTLQRRLARQGLVFDRMLDDVRREQAALYLDDTRLRMAQIAGLLGYAEQSSFNHAFLRWFGAPPSAWRRNDAATRSAGVR